MHPRRRFRGLVALGLLGAAAVVFMAVADALKSSTTLTALGDLSACGPLAIDQPSFGPFEFVTGGGAPRTVTQSFTSPVGWVPWLASATTTGSVPLGVSGLALDGTELFGAEASKNSVSGVAMVFLTGGTHAISTELVGPAGTELRVSLGPAPFDGYNPVFGPQEFLVDSVAATQTTNFTVESRYVGRAGLILVQKADPGGADPLAEFGLTLNGRSLFPRHATGSAVVVCAPLAASNTITATVQGKPGEGIRVVIFPRKWGAALATPAQGVTLAITDPTSGIYGASVTVPPGAATQPTVISIDVPATGMVLPYYEKAVGPVVEIEPTGTRFAAPVIVGIPYSPTLLAGLGVEVDRLKIYSMDPTGGALLLADVVSVDAVHDVVYAEVYHFSQFVVGVQLTAWNTVGVDSGGEVPIEADETVGTSGQEVAAWSATAPGGGVRIETSTYDQNGWSPSRVLATAISDAVHPKVGVRTPLPGGSDQEGLVVGSPTAGVWFSAFNGSEGWGTPGQVAGGIPSRVNPDVAGWNDRWWVAYPNASGDGVCIAQSLDNGASWDPCWRSITEFYPAEEVVLRATGGEAPYVALAWRLDDDFFELDAWDAESGIARTRMMYGGDTPVSPPALALSVSNGVTSAVIGWTENSQTIGNGFFADVEALWTFAGHGSDTIYLGPSDVSVESPSMAADPFGNVHAVWVVYSPALDQSVLLYSYKSNLWGSYQWSAPDQVVPGPVAGHLASPRIVVDARGNLRVTWVDPGAGRVRFAWLLGPQAGNAAFVNAVSGSGQTGYQSMPLGSPMVAAAVDAFGTGVSGTPAYVTVALGEGAVGSSPTAAAAPSYATTADAVGWIGAAWVLGAMPGIQAASVYAFNLNLPLAGSPVEYSAQALADTTPPVVQITVPALCAPVTTTALGVAGSAGDDETRVAAVTVSVTGVQSHRTETQAALYAAPPFPGTGTGAFSASFTLSQVEGVEIVATAVDLAGNAATAGVEAGTPLSQLLVGLASPVNGQAVCSTRTVQVSGVVTDAAAFTVQDLNGGVSLGTPTAFVFEDTFAADGPEVVGVQVTDACGTVVTASVPIVIDASPPGLSILTASSGPLGCESAFPVTGTYVGVPTSIVVNGTRATFSGGVFQATLSNAPTRPLTITAQETDACGRTTDTSVVLVEPAPPSPSLVLGFQAVPGYFCDGQASLTISSGSLLPVTGTIDVTPGIPSLPQFLAIPQPMGQYAASWATPDGTYQGGVTVRDGCGQTGSATFAYAADSDVPEIAFYPPFPTLVCGTSFTFSYGIADSTDTTVMEWFSGGFYLNASRSGTTYTIDQPVNEGLNYGYVSAYDQCNHEGFVQETFSAHTLAPSIAVTSPVNGSVACVSGVQVQGTYTGDVTRITVNGVSASFGGGRFSASLGVTGATTVVAVATDDACVSAGFQATASVSILVGAPPGGACALVGPSGGTVTDAAGAGVVIPPGALGTTTAIAVVPTPGALKFPRHLAEMGPAFEVVPSGLSFSEPVTVVMPISTVVTPGIGLDYRAFSKEDAAVYMAQIPTSSIDLTNQVLYATTYSVSTFAPAFALADFSSALQLSNPAFMSFRSRPTVSRTGAEMMAYINSSSGLYSFAPVERTWNATGWTPEVQVGPWEGFPSVVENTLIEVGVGSDGSELPFYFYNVENFYGGSVGLFSTFYAGIWSPPTQLPWGGNQLVGWAPLPIFDSAGAWHMFFQDQSDPSRRVEEAVSSDQGRTWTSPIPGSQYIPGTAGLVPPLYTAAATGSGGQIYLLLTNGNGTALYYVGSEDLGATWGAIEQVTAPAGNSYLAFPSIAASPGGVVHVLWEEGPVGGGFGPGSPAGSDQIYYDRCTAVPATALACDPVVDLSNDPKHSRDPKLEVDQAGGVNVHWEEIDRSSPVDLVTFLYAFSGDGGKTFSTAITMPPFAYPWAAQEWDGAVDRAGNLRVGFLNTDSGGHPWQIFETHLPAVSAGTPLQLLKVAGGGGSACAGSRLMAQVQDPYGAAVSGAPVTFSTIAGAASLNGSGPTVTVSTDSMGNASVLASEVQDGAVIEADAWSFNIPLHGSPVTYAVEGGFQDPNEPNNTFATATALTVPGSIQSVITSPVDQDWYTFQMSEPGVVDVVLAPAQPDSLVSVSLVNSSGVTIGSTQAYVPGSGVELETTVSNPGGYWIETFDLGGAALCSAPYTLTIMSSARSAPGSPTDLVAMPGPNLVVLSWSVAPAPNVEFYDIYRATSSEGPYNLVGTSAVASYADSTAVDGTTYFYEVSAVYAFLGEGSAVGPVVVQPPGCSGPTVVPGGPIGSDTTWSLCGSPYTVTQSVTVSGGATLSIQPGVEVLFAPGTGLSVGVSGPGALVAIGNTVSPVVFTSEVQPAGPSDHWQGITIGSGSFDPSTLLDGCMIQNAGYGVQGALQISGAAPRIVNTVVTGSATNGVYWTGNSGPGGDATLFYGNTISGNAGYGIYLNGASPRVDSCTIEHAVYASIGVEDPTLVNPVFVNYVQPFNLNLPVQAVVERMSGATFLGATATSEVDLQAGTISLGGELHGEVFPYIANGQILVTGAPSTPVVPVLAVDPGTVVDFAAGRGLTVNNGGLQAHGASFLGGLGITIQGPSLAPAAAVPLEIVGCTISGVNNPPNGAVNIMSASPVIADTVIRGSTMCGISINGGNPSIVGVLIQDPLNYGICALNGSFPAAPYVSGSTVAYSGGHATPSTALSNTNGPADYGLYGYFSGAAFFGNTIGHNLYVAAQPVAPNHARGNTFSDLLRNPVLIGAGMVNEYFDQNTVVPGVGNVATAAAYLWGDIIPETTTWGPRSIGVTTYVVLGMVEVGGQDDPFLIMNPGLFIQTTINTGFRAGATMPGGLAILGAATAPVTLAPLPGTARWYGINLAANASPSSLISHATIVGGGDTGLHQGQPCSAGFGTISIAGAGGEIASSTITSSTNTAILACSASTNIHDNLIVDPQYRGIYLNTSRGPVARNTIRYTPAHTNNPSLQRDYGILVDPQGAPITLIGNSVDHNVWLVSGATWTALSGNLFRDYASYPVQLPANIVDLYFTENTIYGMASTSFVSVLGDTVDHPTTWVPEGGGMPYQVQAIINVGGEAFPTLTLAPGVVMQFAGGGGIQTGQISTGVSGSLTADGVTFEGLTPGQGWWGLNFLVEAGGQVSELQNSLIIGPTQSSYTPNILSQGASLIVRGCTIVGGMNGIRVMNSQAAPVIQGNVFQDSVKAAIESDSGAAPQIIGNQISYSTTHAGTMTIGNLTVPADYGIYYASGSVQPPGVIEGNVVDHNIAFGSDAILAGFSGNSFQVSATYPPILIPDVVDPYVNGTTLYGEALQGVNVIAGTLRSNGTWPAGTYNIYGNVDCAPPNSMNGVWTLGPGALLQMAQGVQIEAGVGGGAFCSLEADLAHLRPLLPGGTWQGVRAGGTWTPGNLLVGTTIEGVGKNQNGFEVDSGNFSVYGSMIAGPGSGTGIGVYAIKANGSVFGSSVTGFGSGLQISGNGSVVAELDAISGNGQGINNFGTASAHDNDLSGNGTSFVSAIGSASDARLNWYGGYTQAAVAAEVSPGVLSSPWLGMGIAPTTAFYVQDASLNEDVMSQATASIALTLSAWGTAQGYITYNEGAPVVGNIVKTLPAFQGTSGAVLWDGTDDSGGAVANGTYFYQVWATRLSDGLAAAPAIGAIQVNRSFPVVEIVSPLDGAVTAAGFVTVAAVAYSSPADPRFNYTLDFAPGEATSAWNPLAQCSLSAGACNQPTARVLYGSPGLSTWGLMGGTYTFRLQASGNGLTSTTYAHVQVLSLSTPTAAPAYFSPCAAGNCTSTIQAPLSIPASWEVHVSDRDLVGSGPAPAAVWDGRDSSGNIVADGRYPYSVSAFTMGVGTTALSGVVVVDRSLPTASITSPNNLVVDSSPASISVMGTASDVNFDHYVLEYGQGATPAAWTQIAQSSAPVSNGSLAGTGWVWKTVDAATGAALMPNDTYVLRLTVVDRAGNAATAWVPMTLDNLLITNVERAPTTINPSQSSRVLGVPQTGQITFDVNRPAQVSAQFFLDTPTGPGGGSLRTLQVAASGTGNTITWDGKTDAGGYVSDEAYLFTLTGTDPQGATGFYSPEIDAGGIALPNIGTSNGYFNPYLNRFVAYGYSVYYAAVRVLLNIELHNFFVVTEAKIPKEPGAYTALVPPYDQYGNAVTDTALWCGIGQEQLHRNSFITVGTNTPLSTPPNPQLPPTYSPGAQCEPPVVYFSYGQFATVAYTFADPGSVEVVAQPPPPGPLPPLDPQPYECIYTDYTGKQVDQKGYKNCLYHQVVYGALLEPWSASPPGTYSTQVTFGIFDLAAASVTPEWLSGATYRGDFFYTRSLSFPDPCGSCTYTDTAFSFQQGAYVLTVGLVNSNGAPSNASCVVNVRH